MNYDYDKAVRLRKRGWPYRKIAEAVGSTEDRIRGDLHKRRDLYSAGPRHTKEQRKRRQIAVAFLFKEGYSFDVIGRALGCSGSVAAQDGKELGLTRKGRRKVSEMKRGPAPVIDWRIEPPDVFFLAAQPSLGDASYKKSPVTADLQHWIEGYDTGDYPNRLAWNLYEAGAAGDAEWLHYARDTLRKAHSQLSVLLRVMADEQFRDECRQGLSLDLRTGKARDLRIV